MGGQENARKGNGEGVKGQAAEAGISSETPPNQQQRRRSLRMKRRATSPTLQECIG